MTRDSACHARRVTRTSACHAPRVTALRDCHARRVSAQGRGGGTRTRGSNAHARLPSDGVCCVARFGQSRAVQYQATCFMNRGLDECPSAAEDRDRDRFRMSLETAPFVVRMVKSIGSLQLHDYKDSLTCEMVKETLKLLDNLVASAVSSKLDESQRLECTTILVKLVTSFHTLMAASEHNAGLPGASGKLSAVELKPAVRALVMFVSPPDVTDVKVLKQTAQHLEQIGPLLSRNDPKLVEGMLSVFTSFLHPFARLSSAECDEVLGHMMRQQGPVAPLVMHLLASATGRIHSLAVSLVCSICLLSPSVLRQLVLGASDDEGHAAQSSAPRQSAAGGAGSAELSASTIGASDKALLLGCIDRAIEHEGKQVRCAGLLRVLEMVLGCITDGHKATAAAKDKSSAARAGIGVILSESDHHKRISDMIFDDDVEEMELREMLEADEIREDELHRSRAVLGAPGRGRAELEIRMQRLRRAKIARLQEAKSRRRHGADAPGPAGSAEGTSSGRAGTALPRDLATGTRVKRGPDWKWHSQDGGAGHEGVVVSGTDKNSDGWVRVQWDKGGVNGYRWGAENSFDVEPVQLSPFSTAVRNKDLVALREAASKDDSDVNAVHSMLTPLMEAINYAEETQDERDVEMVVALVKEFGADPNLGGAGRLPLHLASERARPDIVRALLENKADPMKKDADGLTAIDFSSRCIESTPPDGPRGLFASYGQVLRILEDKVGVSLPIVRHFKFEKEGGQRSFAKGQAGFRYPMPSQLTGNSSFTVSLRIRHLDPTGIRLGRACLLSFGRSPDADKSKAACAKGFSIFLHTRGHMQLGPGLSPTASCTSVNIAICRGRWATLTVVYNSTDATLHVFVDGKLETSRTEHVPVDLDPAGDILVGTPPEGVGKDDKASFTGVLADIQIHDKALSNEALEMLHEACISAPNDAHPSLQSTFCESACRTLVSALNRPMVEANGRYVANTKRHILAILARLLPYCSVALLGGDLKTSLVHIVEAFIVEAPSEGAGKRDARNSAAKSMHTPLVSLLLCVDAIMKVDSGSFEEVMRRSGIVNKILSLSQTVQWSQSSSSWALADTHGVVSYQVAHQANDIALYLIETHFGGEKGATAVTETGKRVSKALSAIRVNLECDGKLQGSGCAYRENQTRQALEQLAALLRKPHGVYSQELLASGLPEALCKVLDSAEDGDDDAACALLESVLGGGEDDIALDTLVTCLRSAVDQMPRTSLPIVLPQDGTASDLRALKQWVTIRFEKCKSDESSSELDLPGGHELTVRAEPLSLVEVLRSTLETMLQSPASGMRRSREDKQGELRAMMQAFGDDPEGAPPSLLEHMRHLVDAEPRSHDVAPPIQRKLEALPSVHNWDREVAVTGAAKRSLPIALTANDTDGAPSGSAGGASRAHARGGSISVASDNDDEEMHDAPEASPVSRLEMLRSAGVARSGNQASESKKPLALDLHLCLGKSSSHGQASARAHELALMHEYDSKKHDEMQEDHAPSAVGERCIGGGAGSSRSSAGASRRASASTTGHCSSTPASLDDDSEQGVLLDDGETLFEGMTRLYALHAKSRVAVGRGLDGRSKSATHVHPGRFWEQNFVVRYRRSAADDDKKLERHVCLELPKTVFRHVLGRGGVGIRKMERETGAKIVQASVGRNEAPMLKVSGLQAQVDQATKLIHASAREAPGWRESRDASIFDLLSIGGRGHQNAGTDGNAPRSSSGTDQSMAASSLNAGLGLTSSGGVSALADMGENVGELAFMAPASERACVRLLDRLSCRMSKVRRRPLGDKAVSQMLAQYICNQLDDSLVVGSGLPSKMTWMLELCKLHSILPLCVRERYFLAAAFGPSRALSTLHNASDPSAAEDGEDSMLDVRAAIQAHAIFAPDRRMYFCPRRPEHQARVPELVQETVEIDHRREDNEDKPPLMTWAEQILEAHSKRETVLHVTWKGEAGHGSGPTRKFFEKVAALLASEEENAVCKVWRDTDDANKCGLFPAKLPEDAEAKARALKRLQLIGLFMGKALQQRQMPGLCLARPLYKLLIGLPVGYEDVKDFDRELAAGVESVLVRRVYALCVRACVSVGGCWCV